MFFLSFKLTQSRFAGGLLAPHVLTAPPIREFGPDHNALEWNLEGTFITLFQLYAWLLSSGCDKKEGIYFWQIFLLKSVSKWGTWGVVERTSFWAPIFKPATPPIKKHLRGTFRSKRVGSDRYLYRPKKSADNRPIYLQIWYRQKKSDIGVSADS